MFVRFQAYGFWDDEFDYNSMKEVTFDIMKRGLTPWIFLPVDLSVNEIFHILWPLITSALPCSLIILSIFQLIGFYYELLFLQPASSTYGDCEETVSPSTEHSPDVNEAVIKTDAVEVASKPPNDKVDNDDSYKEVVDLEPMASDNSSTEKRLTDVTSCDEKTDVGEKVDENCVTDEIVNGDYEEELNQHEDYDDEDGQKSPRQNETDSSENSDFESDEHENDRENGDGQEVSEVSDWWKC